ncbi:MAG: FGGY-family carbohydrate kinase, partial [Pseudomonadota bacterium]
THTRGDVYRALIEGIAFGTNHIIETFAEAGERPSRVLAVGGGVKNRLWLQATSDVTGLDQVVCDKTVGASYGDAFLAAVALGQAERSDIAVWNPVAEAVRAEALPVYSRQYGLFRQLYKQTREISKELGDHS